jgi:hypothetical protein
MLSNEIFALACRAYYDEEGIVVDASNGEFAHCPQPKRYGDTGYYLLWGHHQHQGLLQSRDIGECCFFIGHARKWLSECDYFPENYFELWDIYEKYASELSKDNNKKNHAEKDEFGRSVHSMKAFEEVHKEKDEFGRSAHTMRALRKAIERRDEFGRRVCSVKGAEAVHAKKDEHGESLHAKRLGVITNAKKDENGKSINALKGGEATRESNGKKIRVVDLNGTEYLFRSMREAANFFGVKLPSVRKRIINGVSSRLGSKLFGLTFEICG